MSKATAAAKAASSTTEQPAEALAPALPLVALLQSQLWPREAGVKFTTWEVVPNAATPFEHLTRPEYWANVAARLKPGDKIIAFPRDGRWYGELVVWDAGQNFAQVSGGAQQRPEFSGAPGVEAQFDVARDPIDGWCVKRRASGEVLKKNLPDAEEARRWVIDHQRALRN